MHLLRILGRAPDTPVRLAPTGPRHIAFLVQFALGLYRPSDVWTTLLWRRRPRASVWPAANRMRIERDRKTTGVVGMDDCSRGCVSGSLRDALALHSARMDGCGVFTSICKFPGVPGPQCPSGYLCESTKARLHHLPGEALSASRIASLSDRDVVGPLLVAGRVMGGAGRSGLSQPPWVPYASSWSSTVKHCFGHESGGRRR
ncbi:hypothetical protein C8Q79DRAFT_411574 [Trametes meyenii]|nr:hypothetical protein C8Q79DRAFT_411574 [Trametes meyenii]